MTLNTIGVCSWSLEPRDATALAERATATGVRAVQLALDPIRLGMMGLEETRRRLREAGLAIVSGMMAMEGEDYSTLASIRSTGGVAPDRTWPGNRKAARELARIASELRIGLVTFHAGFLEDRGEILVSRVGELARLYAERDVQVALETGQESAAALDRALVALEREQVGSNFDPANLILYGSDDPVGALRRLAPRVLQVHIKDARPSRGPGEWGREVPVGEGAVDWAAILGALRAAPGSPPLIIEREAGTDRVGDVIRARQFLEAALG